MDARETLDRLRQIALKDETVRERFLASEKDPQPLSAFCRISEDLGFPLNKMDLLELGEERYSAMRRSTNGGGENSPTMAGMEDDYLLFLDELKNQPHKEG